jgi:hypothetical protein
MGFLVPVFTAFSAWFAEVSLTQLFVSAVISTALSTLAALIFAPKAPSAGPLDPTPYTRRTVGGSTPIVVGRRKTYGIEVFRKNESKDGQSSKQFFQILYSVGPIACIYDTRVFNERNIYSLGSENQHTSVIDYRYGTIEQTPTGHGWSDIASDGDYAGTYDSLGLFVSPDAAHSVAYTGRAGLNIFMAADEQGRSAGMNVQVDSVVNGLLCKRFKNSNGDSLCHVGDHNKYIEFYYDSKHYVGTISSGDLTASQLADAVQTALNNAMDDDSTGHSITFTVSYNSETDLFTIASDTDDVTLLTWTGSYRGGDIWDELGILRGARYNFNPTLSGGNVFEDMQISSTISISSFHTFEKSYTRNPIRICFELRSNSFISPGIESPDDFNQAIMYQEEKYCNEIVSVNSVIQYDINPRNILPDLHRIYGNVVSGTVSNQQTLEYLIDGSYTNPADPAGGASGATFSPHIAFVSNGRSISEMVIRTNSVSKTFTVQYVPITIPPTVVYNGEQVVRMYFPESAWVTKETVTNSTDTEATITFSPAVQCNALRIVNFSCASGLFTLFSIVLKSGGYGISYQTHIYEAVSTGNLYYLQQPTNPYPVTLDGNLAGTGLSGPYYRFDFPFKRRIGLISISTNVGEPQSYTIYYQASNGGAWIQLVSRTDQKGSDLIFFDPVEMVAFAITDMSRGDGTNRFSINEVEAYDAIKSRRYTLDAVIEASEKFKDNLQRLYESFFGIPCEENGSQYIRVERDENPVQGLYSEHIVDLKKTYLPRREKINQWNLRYPNELKDFEPDIYTVDDYAGQLRSFHYPGGGTGNVINAREIEFVGATRPLQVARMGHILSNRANYADIVYVIKCLPGAITAGIGKIIKIHYPEKNVINKLARIMKIQESEDMSTEIECALHIPSVYNDAAVTPEDIAYQKDAIGSGDSQTDSSGDGTIAGIVKESTSGSDVSTPMLSLVPQPPESPEFDHYKVYINKNEDTDSSGSRLWSLAAISSKEDQSILIPIDTTGASGNQFRLRVLVQSVSRSGKAKSIREINSEFESGKSRAVIEWDMILDADADPNYQAIQSTASQAAKSGEREYRFSAGGEGSGQSLIITVPAYESGSVRLYADGIRATKYSTAYTTNWQFKELTNTTIEFDGGYLDEDYEMVFIMLYVPAIGS